MQKKSERPVQFEITEQTRDAIAAGITAAHLKPEQFLFPSRVSESPHLSIREYSRIVGSWVERIGLDPAAYGTHSLRRTKATLIYRRTTGQHLAVGVAAEFSGKRPLTRRPAPSGRPSCISMLSNRGGRLPSWTARTQIAVNSLGGVPPHKMYPGD